MLGRMPKLEEVLSYLTLWGFPKEYDMLAQTFFSAATFEPKDRASIDNLKAVPAPFIL